MSAIVQIEELFDTLSREDKFFLIERLVGRMRRVERDSEEDERALAEFAALPNINAPYTMSTQGT